MVETDSKGRIRVNGKVVSDAAIEQRLRRFCAVKKGGKVKSGQEVKDLFEDLSKRQDLIQMFKDAKLNKDVLLIGKIWHGSDLVIFEDFEVSSLFLHNIFGVPLQEDLKTNVHHKILKEQEKKETVKCGWYTERQMKDTLKWSKFGPHFLHIGAQFSIGSFQLSPPIWITRQEIDAVVAYTAKNKKLRKA